MINGMLKVQNLYKSYPEENLGAVIDVSFDLGRGEVLSIVGKSGSGKSTLLRMLAGLMKPDEGTILFADEPLENPEEQLIPGHEKIKMVFQDFKVKPNMSVLENIRYELLQYTEEYKSERSQELLDLCNLSKFAHKKPHELSGGQQQRLSLARALAHDPELLLMDEPFSNLDPPQKVELMEEVVEIIKSQDLSVILVSHDTQDALLYSDRVAFMDEGRMVQIDKPEIIYSNPINLKVAQFFGRINIFEWKGTSVYFRVEDMNLSKSDEGLEVKVLSSHFFGEKYLNKGNSALNETLYFYTTQRQNLGQEVHLTFKMSDELHFLAD